jgi:hypothetical protein
MIEFYGVGEFVMADEFRHSAQRLNWPTGAALSRQSVLNDGLATPTLARA